MSDRHKGEFNDKIIDEADKNRDLEPDEKSLSKFHGAADDLDWGEEDEGSDGDDDEEAGDEDDDEDAEDDR